MLPKARPKKAPVQTPIPRRPGGKWIPVLGKPTPSVVTAASVLVPQQEDGWCEYRIHSEHRTAKGRRGHAQHELEGPSGSGTSPCDHLKCT